MSYMSGLYNFGRDDFAASQLLYQKLMNMLRMALFSPAVENALAHVPLDSHGVDQEVQSNPIHRRSTITWVMRCA